MSFLERGESAGHNTEPDGHQFSQVLHHGHWDPHPTPGTGLRVGCPEQAQHPFGRIPAQNVLT